MNNLRRVLVVDDDLVLRTVVAEALAEEGYDVRAANDGSAALDILAVWPAGLIVLDLMMPGMDGWAFREEQLDREALAGIPVIALSATRDVRAEAARLGAAAALAKPFDLDVLIGLVSNLTR